VAYKKINLKQKILQKTTSLFIKSISIQIKLAKIRILIVPSSFNLVKPTFKS